MNAVLRYYYGKRGDRAPLKSAKTGRYYPLLGPYRQGFFVWGSSLLTIFLVDKSIASGYISTKALVKGVDLWRVESRRTGS